ncbi:MAG: UDP-N-acetylmuramoyl-L-alanine--D-glutamate ligase [Candidatus Coproplasma sp.]
MYFGNQKFLVAGLSRSGEGCVNFLLKHGATVYAYDDVISDKVAQIMKDLQSKGAIIVDAEGLTDAINICDILVLSPGIPIDNQLAVSFRKQGKAILGEEELASLYLRATAVAVTGTNGKTTTVSMLDEVFKNNGKNSVPCGNYGNPLINVVEDLSFEDYAIIEISSFQLETLFSLRPHAAVILNITEDHLNRHYNMENYVYLKSKLIRTLRESEYAVLNYDDLRVRELAKYTRGKVIWISATQRVDGAYVEGGTVCYNGNAYFTVDKMAVGGIHNVYNALACVAVSAVFGFDINKTAQALCSFKGVKHRIQLVGEVNGVDYVDDSKATNVDATIKAVESISKPMVLLLGGKDKGYDYSPLFSFLQNSRVAHAVIYGENRIKMMNAAMDTGYYSFSLCSDFGAALRLANYIAKPGQSVLLSPASASFDEFANFEDRGEKFCEFVDGLKNERAIAP